MKNFLEHGKSLGKILLLMYAFTAVLLFLLAVLLQKLQLKQGAVSIGITVVYVLTCLAGGFLTGKIKKQKKFLWGLLTSLLYFVAMVLVTLVAKGGEGVESAGIFTDLLLCLGGGMLGGMVS